MGNKYETQLSSDQEWIQLFPFGVTLGADETRPIMIFKDESKKIILPVWLSPLDAGISLSQEGKNSVSSSPHKLTSRLMNEVGVKVVKCLFVEIKGFHQLVDLVFEGNIQLKNMRHQADECISFCLFSKVEFFAQRWFVEKSRELDSTMEGVKRGITMEPSIIKNDHPYIM